LQQADARAAGDGRQRPGTSHAYRARPARTAQPWQEVQMVLGSSPAPAGTPGGAGDTPSITALLKRLGNESGELMRAEIALAKLEFRELARQAAVDGAKVGAAAALALVGGIILGAAGVLALGDALGGHYALAALSLGVLLLGIGALLARSGIRGMSRRSGAGEALDTLKQKGAWAAGELRGLGRELERNRPERPALNKP
jgi:hypothetical protein